MRAQAANLKSGAAVRAASHHAFTLVELLVVMGIIGILLAIGLPRLGGLNGNTQAASATRQLIDDLSFARLKAINDRTTVYVVFLTPEVLRSKSWNAQERDDIEKIITGQYSAYAIYSERRLGDQPGPGTPTYLTEWKYLPEGTFISTNKFTEWSSWTPALWASADKTNRPLAYFDIHFPRESSPALSMPAIAFDHEGKLAFPSKFGVKYAAADIFLPLSKGSLVFAKDPANPKKYQFGPPEVIETPRGNSTNATFIHIDWLTGRARMEDPQRNT